MILDRSRNKEHQDLQLSTNLTRVFVLYITLPKVQNEDLQNSYPYVTRRYPYVTRMLLVCILIKYIVPVCSVCYDIFYTNNAPIPTNHLKEVPGVLFDYFFWNREANLQAS